MTDLQFNMLAILSVFSFLFTAFNFFLSADISTTVSKINRRLKKPKKRS